MFRVIFLVFKSSGWEFGSLTGWTRLLTISCFCIGLIQRRKEKRKESYYHTLVVLFVQENMSIKLYSKHWQL